MERKHICASICDRLPTLSANHPWLVNQSLEDDNKDHIVYTKHDPLSQYRCRIPSDLGRRIRGCFHGWVIFSNHPHNDMWALWNPMTSKIIRLPHLILGNGDQGSDIALECCLSSSPDHHGSIFMLTTIKKQTIFFCRLDCEKERLKWEEMSYAEQMRSINCSTGVLFSITCCNGKVYALNTARARTIVIHIDIVAKGRDTVISLLRYLRIPIRFMNDCVTYIHFLKGCCTELFHIGLGLHGADHVTKETFGGVCVYKLDMKKRRWEEIKDLKDAAFFLDLAHGFTAFYSPAIASGLGGYVHFLGRSGKVIHSYNFKNETIALSSLLEHRFIKGDHGKIKSEGRRNDNVDGNSTGIEENSTESRLLNIPSDVLKMIITECCVGVEYLNFRATCKQCHLAAPMVRWSKAGRLQTYSLVSPWLMVVHQDRGVISFTDPMFCHEYFIKTPPQLIGDLRIYCSMSGWLLIRRVEGPLMFFNPFTGDIREIPKADYYLDSYCFSGLPTSPDCMVVGFTTNLIWNVYIYFVAREPSQCKFSLNFRDGSHSFHLATHYDQNLYAMYYNGGLGFIDTNNQDYTWREGPRSSCGSPKKHFLMKHDQRLLLVIVGKFGGSVEVFKLNDSTEWEKTNSLGRHTIYIGGTTCLCIEAKTPEMANKIYFARVHNKNMKIVFYSLETRRYHTSNNEESFGDFIGTTHYLDPHVWIEPSWS